MPDHGDGEVMGTVVFWGLHTPPKPASGANRLSLKVWECY